MEERNFFTWLWTSSFFLKTWVQSRQTDHRQISNRQNHSTNQGFFSDCTASHKCPICRLISGSTKTCQKPNRQTDCKRIIHTHDSLLSFDLHTTHISFFFPLLITDQSNIADPNCLPSSCHFPVQPGADTFFRIKLDNASGWPAALLVLTIGAIGYTKKT